MAEISKKLAQDNFWEATLRTLFLAMLLLLCFYFAGFYFTPPTFLASFRTGNVGAYLSRLFMKTKSPPSWPEFFMVLYSGTWSDLPATRSLI